MKNRLVTALVALATTASAWAGDITVVNPSNKSSPSTVFAMGIKEALGSDFYQASTCEDALNTFKKTPNAVFIYNSSMEFGARNKGISCPLKGYATADNTVFVGQTPMWICRKPGTSHEFKKGANTLGMASMYATKRHEDNFRAAGAEVKIVPYGGSKDIVNAVRAGDITLGWIGSGLARKQVEAGALDCPYSTDPQATNFLGNAVGVTIPDFSIGYVVFTNSRDPKVLQRLQTLQSNEKFQKYLESSLTTGTWKPTQKDLDAMTAKVDKMERVWADKK